MSVRKSVFHVALFAVLLLVLQGAYTYYFKVKLMDWIWQL